MLIELAIGDAYGAGFEYASSAFVTAHNDLARYVQHPRHRFVPGSYTDDTQMAVAVAEVLVSGGAWTREALADSFVRAFKRDPREGYARGFHDFLTDVDDGADFLARIDPRSDKSGAAMRAAPIGVVASTARVVQMATLQARITHDTPDGVNAAVAAALATHYFVYGHGDKCDLGVFLEQLVPGQWSVPWFGKVGEKGWMSVRAALTAIARNDRLTDLLRDCVAFEGDVDTVATIALAAASCCDEIENDLPDHLVAGLETGPFGRDYLAGLDRQLMAMVQ